MKKIRFSHRSLHNAQQKGTETEGRTLMNAGPKKFYYQFSNSRSYVSTAHVSGESNEYVTYSSKKGIVK